MTATASPPWARIASIMCSLAMVLAPIRPQLGFTVMSGGFRLRRAGRAARGADDQAGVAGDVLRAGGGAGQLLQEDGGGMLTESAALDRDGGERRVDQAGIGDIVEAHDREVAPGGEAAAIQGVNHADRDYVVEAQGRRWWVGQ